MTKENNIKQVPVGRLIKEGRSQKDRIVKEVMEHLYRLLPAGLDIKPDFQLSDGSKCRIKAFHPPKEGADGEYTYGFDVKFEDGHALSHLEFSVRCSGWERNLITPNPDELL